MLRSTRRADHRRVVRGRDQRQGRSRTPAEGWREEERPAIAQIDFAGIKEFEPENLRRSFRELGLAEPMGLRAKPPHIKEYHHELE